MEKNTKEKILWSDYNLSALCFFMAIMNSIAFILFYKGIIDSSLSTDLILLSFNGFGFSLLVHISAPEYTARLRKRK